MELSNITYLLSGECFFNTIDPNHSKVTRYQFLKIMKLDLLL